MKRFDKGYIYSNILSDLLLSLGILLYFFEEFFSDEEITAETVIAAIPVLVVAYVVIDLCFLVYRILYYRASGYELTETEIKCNRGVLFKKHSVLDYNRMHAINKKQNILHKIFGIAVLTVDSGSTNTAHLAEIIIIEKEKTVDRLLSELNARKENGVPLTQDGSAVADVLLSDKDSLYRFTSGRKILYTLISVASLAFGTVLFGILAIVVLGICKLVLQLDFLGTWGQYFLFAGLITLGAALLLSAFSLVGCLIQSFVRYHKFTVSKRAGNIEISYGLLERHTNTFSYDKIKAVKISQGLLERLLGFASIRLEVIGYTLATGENAVALGVLIPFCKYDEVREILGKVLPDYVPDQKQTEAVSFFPFVSWFFLLFGGIMGIALLLTVAVLHILHVSASVISAVALAVIGMAFIVLAVKTASAVLSYRTNGIAVNSGKITAYSGGFTRTVTVFMTKNMIAMENVTTPLRKKHGITTLVMHMKTNAQSNEVKVHIQKDTLSKELEELLIV